MCRSDRTLALRLLLLACFAPACGDGTDPALEVADSVPVAAVAYHGRPDPGPVNACGQIDEFSIPPTPEGSRVFPQDIVPGSDGNLWFATFLSFLGRVSPADGSVSLVPIPFAPSRLAAGDDGHIWFGTPSGVARFSPRRETVREIPIPGFGSVIDLTAGPEGAIWVLGFGNIARVTPRGNTTLFPIPLLVGTGSGDHIAAGPDGNLWYTGGGAQAIHRMTRTGVITDFLASGPGQIYGLVAGGDGAMWFTQQGGAPNQNSIGRITTDGVASTVIQLPDSTSTFPNPPSNMPLEIAAGPDKDKSVYFTTYFVEPLNYIGKATPRGALTKFDIPTGGAASFGITAGPDDNIWFTENFNSLIGRLNLASCHPRGGHPHH